MTEQEDRTPDGAGMLDRARPAVDGDYDLTGHIKLQDGATYWLRGKIVEPVNGQPYIELIARRKVPR